MNIIEKLINQCKESIEREPENKSHFVNRCAERVKPLGMNRIKLIEALGLEPEHYKKIKLVECANKDYKKDIVEILQANPGEYFTAAYLANEVFHSNVVNLYPALRRIVSSGYAVKAIDRNAAGDKIQKFKFNG